MIARVPPPPSTSGSSVRDNNIAAQTWRKPRKRCISKDGSAIGIMAAWRCMICFVFGALSLKVLLSHINASHSRSPDFWVYCGIDGCEQDFRVFNSFRHIKRTHFQYFRTGCPPTGWSRTPSSRSLWTGNIWCVRFCQL